MGNLHGHGSFMVELHYEKGENGKENHNGRVDHGLLSLHGDMGRQYERKHNKNIESECVGSKKNVDIDAFLV